MCMDGGILLFTVFDKRCTASLLLTVFFECIAIGWVYGADNFIDNLNEMGMRSWGMESKNGFLRWFWKIAFKFVVPLVMLVLSILAWIDHEPLEYEGYLFPDTVEGIGWLIEIGPLLFILLFPMVRIIRLKRSGFTWRDVWNAMVKSVPLEK